MIAGQPAAAGDPTEAPLNDPPPGLDRKALLAFLVPNDGNTVRALQAAIADAIIKRRDAQQREIARWRAVGRGYVCGAASAGQ